MQNKSLGTVTVAAVVMALSFFCTVKASALLEGKGSLSGTVTGADGKPVVGLVVKLVQDIPKGVGTPSEGGKGGDKGGGKSTKIVGKAITDQNGKFSITNIDEAAYRLEAGNKQQGWIYQDVEIKANEETKLDDLKLVKVK